MSYKIFDIIMNKETTLDIQNCTIKGNSSAYVLKDGVITKYSIINGKIDYSTNEKVDKIELTNYQKSFIDLLSAKDGNSKSFDINDLENLKQEDLENEIGDTFKQNNIYTINSLNIDKYNASIKLNDNNGSSICGIDISFDITWLEKTEKYLKSLWTSIKSLCCKNKAEPEPKQEDKKMYSDAVNIIPAHEYTVKAGDTGVEVAKNAGVSLYRLRKENPDINLDKLQINQIIKIPERASIKDNTCQSLSDTAKAAGVSEAYIKDILFGIEGKSGNPLLRAEPDSVPDINHKKGYLTIGFGHTGMVNGKPLSQDTKITEKEAYQLLAQDILDAKMDAVSYFGEDFLNAPQSIQDAVIDIIFNKGISVVLEKSSSPTNKLKDDLKRGDYVSAALDTRYKTPLKGLKKRNFYRVITATRDLSENDRKKVLRELRPYYHTILDLYSGQEADNIEKAYLNAEKGICSEFFN